MDEVRLNRALADLRESLDAMSTTAFQERDCLSFGEARLSILDGKPRTPAVEAHLRDCRRCRVLVTALERDLPHLPFWTLLRAHLDLLTFKERQTVEYHLEAGNCRVCRARSEQLYDGPLIQLRLKALGTIPSAVMAATSETAVLARAEHEGLEAELIDDQGSLTLEVRTRRGDLAAALIAYSLTATDGSVQVEGYLVLGDDVEGWLSAETIIPTAENDDRNRPSQDLWIALVQPAALSEEEWRGVVAAAPLGNVDSRARSAWAGWCSRMLQGPTALSESTRDALGALLSRLNPPDGD